MPMPSIAARAESSSAAGTAISGAPLYSTPGVGLGGKLSKGSLEGSNVDITSELVGLMTSQRNYQANAKTIETESAITQTIINLR